MTFPSYKYMCVFTNIEIIIRCIIRIVNPFSLQTGLIYTNKRVTSWSLTNTVSEISEKIDLALVSRTPIVCLYCSHSHLILRKRACPWRTVIPRWQRAALDLTDLNLMKERSDLKKECAGRKSSFSTGLLTSDNLSSVDSTCSAIRSRRVIARDLCWSLWSSGCYIFTSLRNDAAAVDLTRSTEDRNLGNSRSVKNLIRSRSGRELPLAQSFLSTMRFFVFSFFHARHASHLQNRG